MRQYISIIGITCALVLGGWGGALAAAWCPHERGGGVAIQASDDAHACCPIKKKTDDAGEPDAHCSGATEKRDDATHEAAASHHGASDPSDGPVAERGSPEVAAEFSFAPSPCGHCVTRREQFPAFARTRAPGDAKRDSTPPAAHAPRRWRAEISSHAPVTQQPRGAPPGHGARRHVLINVFLI